MQLYACIGTFAENPIYRCDVLEIFSKFSLKLECQQAEIQTDRQKLLLLDTSKAPVESIRAGGRYDFIVEHDVKELGPHTYVNPNCCLIVSLFIIS